MPQERIKRTTISDVFCDTYVEIDPNPRRGGYISISKIITDKYYSQDNSKLFMPGADHTVFDRDGFPVHKVRTRFCHALRKCGDNVCRLYNTLNQVFTEDAIKFLFDGPNVWLLNHNYLARKASARAFNEENRKRKLIPRKERVWKAGIANLTANRSAKAHARYIRSLQVN